MTVVRPALISRRCVRNCVDDEKSGPLSVHAAARVGILSMVVVFALVAHGCHGDDADHEPGFSPPARRTDAAGLPD